MGRNVNGEGNIRQRSDGRWEGRAYVITTDGREIRRSVYGKTWQETHDKLTRLQADTMTGKRIASSRQTVSEYLDYWLRTHARRRVRGTTFRSYEWLVRAHLVPVFGKKRLTNLRRADVRRGLDQLKETCQCCAQGKDKAREDRARQLRAKRAGRPTRKDARPIEGARCCAKSPPECCGEVLSDGSIRYVHRLLRVILQDAVSEDEILTENVAKGLRVDHKYRPRFTAWSPDEAARFLRTARSDRLYALYAVALSLGLRRGEALGLRWSDVDLERGRIRVRYTLSRADGKLALGPVKTDRSERLVAVPPQCLGVLREHRRRQGAERESAGSAWNDEGYVFTTSIGTPIEPRNLNRHFDHLREESGVRKIRFHDLRHSCATLLYGLGVPVENIQDVLGHSSAAVTKMFYVDDTERAQRDAVNRLDFLLDDESTDGDRTDDG